MTRKTRHFLCWKIALQSYVPIEETLKLVYVVYSCKKKPHRHVSYVFYFFPTDLFPRETCSWKYVREKYAIEEKVP